MVKLHHVFHHNNVIGYCKKKMSLRFESLFCFNASEPKSNYKNCFSLYFWPVLKEHITKIHCALFGKCYFTSYNKIFCSHLRETYIHQALKRNIEI